MKKKPRVLVVEDDTATQKMMTLILEGEDFEVETVGTCAEALDRTTNHDSYDIGILDIKLPDGEGTDLLAPLKTRHPDMELIVLTGNTSAKTAIRALSEGASAYITKPVNVDEIRAEVKKSLEKRRLVVRKRRAEAQLRKSTERYRTLFESMPIGLYRMTADGQILHANQALVDMLGYPDRRRLMEVDADDWYVVPEERDREKSLLERDGVVRGFETQLRRHDGTIIWARETVRVSSTSKGYSVTYQGSLEDITERRTAQETLRESERRFRRMFEYAPSGMALIDTDGCFMQVNQAMCEALGYAREELTGKSFVEVTHLEDREFAIEVFQAQLAGRSEHDRFEKRFIRRDGTVIWAILSTSMLRDSEGEPLYQVSQIQNITGRKQAEEALRKRVQELTCLYRVSRDMQENLSTEDLCRRSIRRLVSGMRFPEIAVSVIELDDRRFSSEEISGEVPRSLRAQIEAEGKDRGQISVSYTEDRPFSIPEEQNLLDTIAEALGRWLERKEARDARRRTQALLTQVETLAKVGGWEYDVEEQKIAWTEQVYRIHGVDPATYDPSDLAEDLSFYSPEDQSRIQEAFQRAVETGEPYDLEVKFQNAQGQRMWVRIVADVEQDDGEVRRVYGHIMDVTDRKKMEKQLRQQARLAAMGQLAGGIAHDFNNILTTIIFYAQIPLADSDLPPRTQRELEIILEESYRAAELIQQILDFTRNTPMATTAQYPIFGFSVSIPDSVASRSMGVFSCAGLTCFRFR